MRERERERERERDRTQTFILKDTRIVALGPFGERERDLFMCRPLLPCMYKAFKLHSIQVLIQAPSF